MTRLALFLATFAGSGYFPIAPGTAGSAAALVLVWAVKAPGLPWLEPLALALVLLAGAWAATVTERVVGATDPGIVVIDEVLGMLAALFWIPLTPATALAAFFLFRVLDVIKPFPARRLEAAHGGWGIMLDDFAAGIYAWLGMRALLALFPGWFL
ncbi:MAG: phosphatidylglycerophosphatase A [Vicinamibacterales bacterium]